MWINHKLVDFSNAAKMHRVTPGCTAGEEEADEAGKEVIEPEGTDFGLMSEDTIPQEPVIDHEHSGT